MNYDIKIRGEDSDNGSIEFERLGNITKSTKDIAIKSLMLKTRGYSDIKPEAKIKKALEIRLQGLSGDKLEGTSMLINCDHFRNTLKGLQYDMFIPTDELMELTPMSLVIQSFRAALIEGAEKDDLDKPLLKALIKFKRNFTSNNEVIFLSNRNTIPGIEITLKDFRKIEKLEEDIPDPKKVMVNGQLDEMKYSKSKLVLVTSEGPVNAFTQNQSVIERIVNFMGKEITVFGMAHYKPGGQLSYIDIEDFSEPGQKDKIFSKKPSAYNTQEQIVLQLKSGKSANPLTSLEGQWPGDESLEDLLKMLDE